VVGAVQVLAVSTACWYRHLALTQSARDLVTTQVHAPLGALSIPPINTLWTMTAIGLVAMATAGGTATGDVGGKALHAFSFLAYMPFLILLYHRRHGKAYCDMAKQGPLILAYLGVLVLVAMARNGRQLLAIGPVQAALIFLVYFLQDPTPITTRTIRRLTALTVAVTIGIVLFADLAGAKVINREKVANLSIRAIKVRGKVWHRQGTWAGIRLTSPLVRRVRAIRSGNLKATNPPISGARHRPRVNP